MLQHFLICSASLVYVAPAYAMEWADLWSSAEQRAQASLQEQQYDKLIQNAPDANWRGLGEYRKGDYAAAAQSFSEQSKLMQEAGRVDDAVQAMYNQANAHVYEENYMDALSLFDEILELNPQYDNAKHNREITQQLLEEQQEQQQEQQEQEGENQESSDEQSEGEPQEQDKQDSGDSQDSEQESSQQGNNQNQDGEPQKGESDDNQKDSNSAADNAGSDDSQPSASAEEQAAQDAAAAAAMQAEQQRQDQAQPTDEDGNTQVEPMAPAPLTEREQANEQWLRQIPDDPAGLLERKLQNRHLTDYPQVRDSNEPW